MGALTHIGMVIVAALMAAACDGGVTAPTTIAPATPTTPVAPTTTTTTTPAATSVTTTPTPITTPPTSSPASTAMPTTTTPDAGVIGAVCGTLGSGRWDERRDSIAAHEPDYAAAGGAGPLVDAVRTACPDALARTEAAIDLAARMAVASQALAEEEWVDLPLCADEIVTVELRNPTAEPIGVVVATGATEHATRYDAVVVEWSLAPGSTRLLTLPHPGTIDCWVWTFPFGADPSAVDGAVPGVDGPLTTGDDPAQWLPELLLGIPGSWTTGAETLAGRYDSTDLRDIGLDDARAGSGDRRSPSGRLDRHLPGIRGRAGCRSHHARVPRRARSGHRR